MNIIAAMFSLIEFFPPSFSRDHMHLKNLFIAVCFLFSYNSLFAQQDTLPAENWDTYLAQYDNQAGSIILNMSLKEVAPIKNYPIVVITGVGFKDCKDGFPSKREFNNLYKISDSVKSVIDRNTENILAGTFTFLCERLDYFFVKDSTNVRQQLLELYQSKFPGYTPYINIKEDKKWNAYLDFLYPNEETLDFMGNEKIVMALKKAGDKLVKERPVEHWAYFKTDADRNCYITYLSKNKFRIAGKGASNIAGTPFKLIFSRTDKVDVVSISKITFELRKQATLCKGDYDGWETVLIK